MPVAPQGPPPAQALPQGQLACPTEGVCQQASLHPRTWAPGPPAHTGPQSRAPWAPHPTSSTEEPDSVAEESQSPCAPGQCLLGGGGGGWNWAAGNRRQSIKPQKGVGTGLEGTVGPLSPKGAPALPGRRGLGRPWCCPLGPVLSAGDTEQGFGADAQGHSEPIRPCHHGWAPERHPGPPQVAPTLDLRVSAAGTVGSPGRGSPGGAGPEAGDPASIRAGICLPPLIPTLSFLAAPGDGLALSTGSAQSRAPEMQPRVRAPGCTPLPILGHGRKAPRGACRRSRPG